jgi:hypothetical protein
MVVLVNNLWQLCGGAQLHAVWRQEIGENFSCKSRFEPKMDRQEQGAFVNLNIQLLALPRKLENDLEETIWTW